MDIILVIEHDPELRLICQRFFEWTGYRTVGLDTDIALIEQVITGWSPNAIVLPLEFAQNRARELVDKLRQTPIAIVAISPSKYDKPAFAAASIPRWAIKQKNFAAIMTAAWIAPEVKAVLANETKS